MLLFLRQLEDYRLPLGSALIGVGTDDAGLGLYSDDIEGHTRTSTWDIGADEYIAAVGVTFTEHRSTLFEFQLVKLSNKGVAGQLILYLKTLK